MLRRFFQDYKQLEGKAVEVDEIPSKVIVSLFRSQLMDSLAARGSRVL